MRSASPSAATAPCSTDAQWSLEGQKIIHDKEQANLHPQPSGQVSGNAGLYAYASRPVDVSGPGTYRFDFGPVSSDFVPSGFVYMLPPDFQVDNMPLGPLSLVTVDGSKYLEGSISLGGKVPTCRGLVAWAY